jgi:hypothetical protein
MGPEKGLFTHYSASGASTFDHIYAKRNFLHRKLEMQDIAAAFTDHFAVCLRLTLDIPIMQKGWELWKLGDTILNVTDCKDKLRAQWEQWTRRKGL